MADHVGPSTSHRQGLKLASAMPVDSSETLQLSQRNDWPEPATIARNSSLQSAKGKYRLLIKKRYFWTYFPCFAKSAFFLKKKVVA